MIVRRSLSLRRLMLWSWRPLMLQIVWNSAAVTLFYFTGMDDELHIPWLPVSLIGTAVAFYVGFKNDSAYERLWEARKIWGAIVNTSRSWGTQVKAFVSNQFRAEGLDECDLNQIHRRLVYRHLAWLYSLRSQLLMGKEWEHPTQAGVVGRTARYYQKEFGVGMIDDDITERELHRFLPLEEFEQTIEYQNTATHIIDRQSQELKELRAENLIDDFRHMVLQRVLSDLYDHQGKCERIKNFPLPRQYANGSSVFVGIFIALLPFGMASEFAALGTHGIWYSIPFSILVGWVFIMMEAIGDYSENPFTGMANDIPMFSICRTIEIDLREMLGELDLPPKVEAKNGILM